jgi:hypothetical protein
MKIILYDEGAADILNIAEIGQYLSKKLNKSEIEPRADPFAPTLSPEDVTDLAWRLADIRIQDIRQRLQPGNPLYGEVEFEKRRILGKTKAFGIPYEGLLLQKIFTRVIPVEQQQLSSINIVFTNRLFATWDNGDRRYHLRSSVYGMPSVISTTGIVEAPAKPREYYLYKQQYESLKKDPTQLKIKFAGRLIDYEDERLTEVAKGLAMQAAFYSLTGNPFCDDKGCRLYNAHWQEDLIFAQLESDYEFCQQHQKLLTQI